MEDNPFSVLVGEIKNMSREQTPVTFRVGRVVSASPLRVETGGIVLEPSEIYINNMLTVGFTKPTDIHINSGNLQINGESSAISGHMSGEIQTRDNILLVGDRVIMLTESDTTFYILCKVVRP